MRLISCAVAICSLFSLSAVHAETKGPPLAEKEVVNRSITAPVLKIVLYSDGTYERRASFYPRTGKKHWASVKGKWTRDKDGRFYLTQSRTYFHDSRSKNSYRDGSCILIYRNNLGTIRAALWHANGDTGDGPVKIQSANDGYHFPSIKALQATGAKQITPAAFLKAATGRSFVVDQWLGLKNFSKARKPVFHLSGFANGAAQATNRQGKTAAAKVYGQGKSLCTHFKFSNLWADGCGTAWQTPDGRIYVVSDKSGYAYMGGQFR
ncbi:hypothetical protein [Pseudooceanicola sp.]|uniref:hypothetical protein n=1 Tax=Pseudooceanicola sp. TaxID=1914328 RepID=UPI002602DE48|nr:hypothetical protein [Pseudooceanicola sp.]MDF1855552.1 hypothetical protein [Pseudooceanicola sp.]